MSRKSKPRISAALTAVVTASLGLLAAIASSSLIAAWWSRFTQFPVDDAPFSCDVVTVSCLENPFRGRASVSGRSRSRHNSDAPAVIANGDCYVDHSIEDILTVRLA
jgi:hypothetical protein